MELGGIEAAAPGGVCTEGEPAEEADALHENGDEAGIAALEGGLELHQGGGRAEVAVGGEAAELPDGLVDDGGGGGGEAAGDGVAARIGVQAVALRGGPELLEDGDHGEALEGGLGEPGLLEEVSVWGGVHFFHTAKEETREGREGRRRGCVPRFRGF